MRKRGIDSWKFDGSVPEQAAYIERGEYSLSGCLRMLRMFHLEVAEYAWFAEQDLTTFKQHCYVASRLFNILSQVDGGRGVLFEGYWYDVLFSDYEPLIRWGMAQTPISKEMKKDIDIPRTNIFRFYQMTLALKGDWDELGRRAELFLADIPKAMKRYTPDMRFYLALAQHDKAGMENAVAELVSPKGARYRNKVFELPFCSQFISSFASLYVKVARRHGYELDIESKYIPQEWIPISPLENYTDPYNFMKKWEIK